jgi:coenzyme F420-reducing hydrogenase delta subunit
MTAPIRRFEITDAIERIYSELSVDTPKEKRKDKARAVIRALSEIGIEKDDFRVKSDIFSDAEIKEGEEI